MRVVNGAVHTITKYSQKKSTLIELPKEKFVKICEVKSKLDLFKLYLIANEFTIFGQTIFKEDDRIIFLSGRVPPGGYRFVYKDSLEEAKEARKILFKI